MTSAAPVRALLKAEIESALASAHGRRFCCLTNRGTTALAAAIAALELPADSQILFPAAMCSVPVYSALFAGRRPVFADVNLEDANFDLDDVERKLKNGRGRIGAVVPVHMFGRPERVSALAALCARYGAVIIEDGALSMGAAGPEGSVGSFGRLSCLSFVRKMLPLEMGGAVLTDDPALDARARRWVDELPPLDPARREEVSAAMKSFHQLTGQTAAGDWKDAGRLAPWEEKFRGLLLARTDDRDWADSIVLDELRGLPGIIEKRRARAEVYETVFQHPRLKILDRAGSALFTFPVRLLGVAAEDFLSHAEEKGFRFQRAAYPNVAPVFGGGDSFPNADVLEREAVGCPLDDDQPVSSFWGYAQDFLALFGAYLSVLPARPPFDARGKLEQRMGE